MTTSVSTVEGVIPPIIGTATRCMIPNRFPVLELMGSKLAMIATKRSTAPTIIAR